MKARKWKPADGLPMPLTGTRRVSRDELDDYRRAQEAHHERRPDYEKGWDRPTPEQADEVWKLSRRLKIREVDLRPEIGHAPEELPSVEARVRQAFLVAVETAVSAGEAGRMLTVNLLFDALASRWSDNYRAAVEGEGLVPRSSYEMPPNVIRASRRDLLRLDIDLARLYRVIVKGCRGFYATKRTSGKGHARGYTVTVKRRAVYQDFRKTVPAPVERSRLLLAHEVPPHVRPSYKMAGGYAYNIVPVAPRAEQMIALLEASRVRIDRQEVVQDCARMEDEQADVARRLRKARRRLKRIEQRADPLECPECCERSAGVLRQYRRTSRRLREQADKANAAVWTTSPIKERLAQLPDDPLIRSGFRRAINGRYHALNIWPSEVTGKDVDEGESLGIYDPDENTMVRTSRRGRWFYTGADEEREHLVGYDVSGSQGQILAVVTGQRDLEKRLAGTSMKELLAGDAWRRHHDPTDQFRFGASSVRDYESAGDPRLISAVKAILIPAQHGAGYHSIAKTGNSDHKRLGPGFGDAENVEHFFKKSMFTRYVHEHYLPACSKIAAVAFERDPYAGVKIVDPYSGAEFQWGRPALVPRIVSDSGGVKIYAALPRGPQVAGRYLIDLDAMTRFIRACVVHLLDSVLSGFVVTTLSARGVTNVIANHDCWIASASADAQIQEAIRAAGEPWLRSLGSIYEFFLHYLRGTEFEDHVITWRQTWRERVARGDDWPAFLFKPEDLYRVSQA